MANLPGQDFASEKGYILAHHAGDLSSAVYVNYDKLTYFTVTRDPLKKDKLRGEIYTYYKNIKIASMQFSLPHTLFDLFENQVLKCRPPLNEVNADNILEV